MDSQPEVAVSTPMYSHIWSSEFKDVYEPAEDTFILLDALENDVVSLTNLRPSIVLEVGVGSGIVVTFLQKLLGSNVLYMGTDINHSAISCSKLTASVNKCPLELIQDNLVCSLVPRLNKMVDIIVFNPPYVVTESDEVGSKSIEAAWAGGIDGREVTDQFLPFAAELLSSKGVLYLVLIDKNNPDEIIKRMKILRINGKIIASRKAGIEYLLILKFWR